MIDFLSCFADIFIRFFNSCDVAIYLIACVVFGVIIRLFISFFLLFEHRK